MGSNLSIQQIMDDCRERVKSGNRVLTLEEVLNNAKNDGWPLFVEINIPGHVGRWTYPREMRGMSKHDKETYNITWRAWKFVPSEEERRKFAWIRAEIIPMQQKGGLDV